ncbi:MAG: hypothetical protein LBK60_03195 [Verrucomicrobiales bacterium]|jgi:hypothetical protein|nr:hypothetical protein [Verrucomicrobiales bacterium]
MKKYLAIIVLVCCGGWVMAQTDKEEWLQDLEAAKALAVAAYPDVANANSALVVRMNELDGMLKKQDSPLTHSAYYPFMLSAVAAFQLGMPPQPSAATKESWFDAVWSLGEVFQVVTAAKPNEAAIAKTEPPAWKIGDTWPELRLADGTVYQNARLTRVEPNGITVSHQSGSAKIAYEKLPADLREKFNHNPAAAADYALEQKYKQQIAVLQGQVESLQKQLRKEKGFSNFMAEKLVEEADRNSAGSATTPSIKGFTLFKNEMINKSGVLKYSRTARREFYSSGPLSGKTEEQAQVFLQQEWERMGLDGQLAYEEKAAKFGTGQAKRDPTVRVIHGNN